MNVNGGQLDSTNCRRMTKCGGRFYAEEGLGGMNARRCWGVQSNERGVDTNIDKDESVGDTDNHGKDVLTAMYIIFNSNIEIQRITLQMPSPPQRQPRAR
jgi:hypothetical protein